MALVLDPTTIAPRERAEAVRAAMLRARVPALLEHEAEEREGPARPGRAEPGAVELRTAPRSGPRAVRALGRPAGRPRRAVRVRPVRRRLHVRGERRPDRTRPADGRGAEAAGRLPASPLYRLLVEHVLGVARDIDVLPAGPATRMLGAATLELIRALVASAADPVAGRPDDDAGVLLTQTKIYVQRHFADPGLTPARIARAHAVSVRRLYAVWSTDRQSLAEHIMAVRLEAARSRLAASAPRPPAIATVGRDCGFADMAHFARRFRSAYGMTPSDWRRAARA